MKIKRYKKIRKILHSYQITHNIKAPYKVAVDGEFVQSALAGQIMLKEQLPKMLQEERTTVFVTPCIDNWLRLKGPQYSGALFIASKLAHLKCRHDKGFVRPFDCIRHLIANGNPDHLLIGAQDEPIRKLVRHCAGVPLLFIHGSTCIMEAPTVTTKEAHADDVAKQLAVIAKEEKKLVHEAKKVNKAAEGAGAGAGAGAAAATSSGASSSSVGAAGSQKKKKKAKGPKQPNPLSVKKKKATAGGGGGGPAGGAAASASNKKASATTAAAADGADAHARPLKKIKTESGAPSDATAATAAASASPASAAPPASGGGAGADGASSSGSGAAVSSSASGSKGRKRARSYKKKSQGSEGVESAAVGASMDDAP